MNPAKYVPVSKALYHATTKPELGKTVPFDSGFCGCCKAKAEVALAGKILTSTFGSWDNIAANPTTKQRHLCLPCAWAFRAKELKYHPTIISSDGATFIQPNGTELRRWLSQPIPPDVAIILPVNGKKAVAPWAKWGKLTTDTGPMEWTRRLAKAAKAILELKTLGFNEPGLREDAPPFHVVAALPPDQQSPIHATWRALQVFREDKAIFPVLLKATREKM